MTTAAFLDRLRTLGVRLEPAAGRLWLQDPRGVLTDALRGELADRKADVLAFFREARAMHPPRRVPVDHGAAGAVRTRPAP